MDSYWNKLAYGRVGLENCESEPLQFCGAIQACGWVVVTDPSGVIVGISENASALFGRGPQDLLGQNYARIQELFENRNADAQTDALTARLRQKSSGKAINTSSAPAGPNTLVEFEFDESSPAVENLAFVEHLRGLVREMDFQLDTDPMLGQAVDQVRKVAGYDRVMLYQFDSNWNGRVTAESRQPDLDPFLDLNYPASDIPAQARALYLNSPYRMIVDVHSEPVSIVTRKGLAPGDITLEGCNLRAVSPFHIQYLKNMGVRSSLSLPIKVNGKLWGLIACHSYTGPITLSREVRLSCELVSQLISGRLTDHLARRRVQVRNRILVISHAILRSVTEGKDPIEAFRENETDLLEMGEAAGMHVRLAGESTSFGSVPPDDYIDLIVEKLKIEGPTGLWHSQELTRDLSLPPHPAAIGALAVPLSFGFEELIIWFRPEQIREVRWAGNPRAKAMGDSLNPRASFESWTQKVKGQSREWREVTQEAAQFLLYNFIKDIFQKAADLSKANRELARVTQAKDEFIGMISHELRTPLGVMIGWIDILRDSASTDPKTLQALEIIERNARLQVNLINDLLDVSRIISGKMRLNQEDGVNIEKVVREVVGDLRPTAASKDIDLLLELDDIVATVDPERIRQIVWNLASNAIKFTPKRGRVKIALRALDSSYQISVEDSGAGIAPEQLQRIFERFAQSFDRDAAIGGLGLGLSIAKSLVELHGGSIYATSPGVNQGATFVATFPVSALKFPKQEQQATPADAPAPVKVLAGVRILVAEDTEDAALALEFVLKKAGAVPLVTHDGEAALQAYGSQPFDLLLSDIGMPKMDGIELITRIRSLEKARQTPPVPAIALTAYATSKDRIRCLAAGFGSHIAKPVDREELFAVIDSLGVRPLA